MPPMTTCRACRRDTMDLFLPLGMHPPANAFLKEEQLAGPQPAFPLDTHVCLSCGLIQVPNVIPPDFFRNYLYVPSASDTLHVHFKGLALALKERAGARGLVVDIGSNDGLLLGALRDVGARALGIEPAVNLTAIARARGLEVLNDYFTPATARQARESHGPATAIVTTNTFNHIDDLHGFMEGVTILLDDTGVFVVEVPHSLDLVVKNEFDTIYHEHLSEFSVKSLVDLYAFFGMEVAEIERLEIHGGSMRVFGRRRTGGPPPRVAAEWMAREEAARLFSVETYRAFRTRVEDNRKRLLDLLAGLKREGKRIVGYGAPAKGNTLLNYYNLGTDVLDYLVDRNSLKQGLYSPGMRIPVRPVEALLENRPDYLLILAWNFADEVMQQQRDFQRAGGRFIVPIPEPQVV